jgi:membrane protein implicated in regulation of membrane protease activity
MAMGRPAPPPPPEEADSWGEFHARIEGEAADLGHPLFPLWWGVAGLLYGIAMVCCAFATRGGRWWLWLCMLGLLAVVGVMAARAVERADRQRARAAQLARLEGAWEEHLEQGSRKLLRGETRHYRV